MKTTLQKRNYINKLLSPIVFGAPVILILWIFFSWINLISHNLDVNPVYWSWNFFVVLGGVI